MTFPRGEYAASYGVLEGDTMKVISVAGETLASCLLQ
ncbi:phosphodiesterase [Vibrio cholerae]|nr:phosphodiesterase [Vibrio cholerae]